MPIHNAQRIKRMKEIPSLEIDFLPEGQLKWRCLEKAESQIPKMTLGVDHDRSERVLAAAKEIYDWLSSQDLASSTNAFDQAAEKAVENARRRAMFYPSTAYINNFDSYDTMMRTRNLLDQMDFPSDAINEIINTLGDAGIRFVSK